MSSTRVLVGSSTLLLVTLLLSASVGSAQDEPTRSTALEATTWRLAEYHSRDTQRSTGPEVAARLSFKGGKLQGSGGCNSLEGRYATIGIVITIELGDRPQASCAEQTMLVEMALLEGLQQAHRFTLLTTDPAKGPELVLSDASDTELLRFSVDDASSLTRSEWRLVEYTASDERVSADPSRPAVLAFDADRENAARRRSNGTMVGSSGCNGIVADYFQHASVLSLGALQMTDAPCTASAAAQEAAMVAVLDATSQVIELPPDRLVITSSDTGERLEFVTATPVEGSTWLLMRIPGARRSSSDVTMRLLDGAVSGEGPCGPYWGNYESDGVLLFFDSLTADDASGCKQRKAHRSLMKALRDTVSVDALAPGIRLLDAFGRSTARFRHPGGP